MKIFYILWRLIQLVVGFMKIQYARGFMNNSIKGLCPV